MTIVKSVLLPLPPGAAFALFTERAGAWWPSDRRHTGDPASDIVLAETGRFFERARDGREVELGFVRAWEPPHRLLLDFYIASGPDKPTEIEIAFVEEGAGTRVTVTHRPTPASAALWSERAPRYATSWDLVLASLLGAAG
jgi:hypothetical protein